MAPDPTHAIASAVYTTKSAQKFCFRQYVLRVNVKLCNVNEHEIILRTQGPKTIHTYVLNTVLQE